MIEEISKLDRRLGMEVRMLKKKSPDEADKIFCIVDKYLEDYCKYYKLSPYNVIDAINKFSIRYSEDLKVFTRTDKFPYEFGQVNFSLSRIEYDLSLICSIFFTEHRFSILNEINRLSFAGKHALSVGVGSGIELEFILQNVGEIDAYDITVSEFLKERYRNINLIEKHFIKRQIKYDIIFAIEILEHLKNPYQLIEDMCHSLLKRGKLVTTTIKNVPQFDHIYNFISDEEFEMKTKEIGLSIEKKIVVPHNYRFLKIDANNIFYVLTKKVDG